MVRCNCRLAVQSRMPEGGGFTRWIVLIALSAATAVVFLVSLRCNFLFGYSLGQTDDKRVLFAWANVGADLWKAFGLIAITMLWRVKHRRAAFVGSIAWFMCLTFGINSALGIYVADRTALTGDRAAAHDAFEDRKQHLSELEDLLRARPAGRASAEIEAAIAAELARSVVIGERSRGTVDAISRSCTKADARTEAACAAVRSLQVELATAREREKLAQRIETLREDVARMRRDGSAIAPDPIGEFYAWLSRGLLSVRDVSFGFPLFFALLIEAVSAFGPVTIAAYAEATRPPRDRVGHGPPRQAASLHDEPWQGGARHGLTDQSRVIQWLAARAIPTESNRPIALDELYRDFARWCGGNSTAIDEMEEFERTFDAARQLPELTGKIRKFGRRYYGIALADSRRSVTFGRSRSA